MSDLQHESTTRTGPTDHRRSTLVAWLVGGLALALVALVGLGTWTYVDRDQPTETTTVSGLATPEVTAMLAARVAAVNGGDPNAIASYYAPDAVLEELDQAPPVVTRTAAAIGDHLADYAALGFRLQQTGTAIELGPFVTEPLIWSGGAGGLVTYQLDSQGKIEHQWVPGASIASNTW